MRLLFDAATSPVLAATLGGYVRHRGHAVVHARELSAGGGDAALLAALREGTERPEGPGGLLVSGDARLPRGRAQRLAFREAALRVLVLAPAFLRLKMHEQAAALVARWPEIEALDGVPGPFLHEVPAASADRLRVL